MKFGHISPIRFNDAVDGFASNSGLPTVPVLWRSVKECRFRNGQKWAFSSDNASRH